MWVLWKVLLLLVCVFISVMSHACAAIQQEMIDGKLKHPEGRWKSGHIGAVSFGLAIVAALGFFFLGMNW